MSGFTRGDEPIHPPRRVMADTRTRGDGLTVREYFAAMAMQGFMASYAGGSSDPSVERVATMSVAYADALIAELAKAAP